MMLGDWFSSGTWNHHVKWLSWSPFWHLYSLVKMLKNNYSVNYKLYIDSLRQFSHPHLTFFFFFFHWVPLHTFKTRSFLHSLDETSQLKYLSWVHQGGNGRAGHSSRSTLKMTFFCYSLLPFLEACPWIQFPCQHLGIQAFLKDDLASAYFNINDI